MTTNDGTGAGVGAATDPATTAMGGIEAAVAAVLRVGVVGSCLVIAAGSVVTVTAASTRQAARRSLAEMRRGVLHPAALRFPHTVGAVARGVGHGNGPSIVMLGVLLLIATPVFRVAVGAVGFALQRDGAFVVITVAVLAVLLASFALG